MTARPVLNDVTEYNPMKTIYWGDKFTDGSRRIRLDPPDLRVDEITEGVWNLGPLLLSGDSIDVGRNVTLSAAGDFGVVNSLATGSKSIMAVAKFDDSGSFVTKAPRVTPRFVFPVQPVGDTEVITKKFISIIVGFIGTINSNLIFKSGSIAATDELTYTSRLIDENGPILYQRAYPASAWPANSSPVFEMVPPFDFPLGTPLHNTIESDEDFSILTNGEGRHFLLSDMQAYITEDIVTFGDSFTTLFNEDVPAGTDRILSDSSGNILVEKDGDIVFKGEGLHLTNPTFLLPPTPPIAPIEILS